MKTYTSYLLMLLTYVLLTIVVGLSSYDQGYKKGTVSNNFIKSFEKKTITFIKNQF